MSNSCTLPPPTASPPPLYSIGSPPAHSSTTCGPTTGIRNTRHGHGFLVGKVCDKSTYHPARAMPTFAFGKSTSANKMAYVSCKWRRTDMGVNMEDQPLEKHNSPHLIPR